MQLLRESGVPEGSVEGLGGLGWGVSLWSERNLGI